MIEVNMTVNELAENTEMDVATAIRSNIKNPFIHLTITNNNDPFDVRSISYLTIEDGNLVSKLAIASAGRTTYADVLTTYYKPNYVYAFNFDDMRGKSFTNLVNVELFNDQGVFLEVIDPNKYASATLTYYYNPLPPE